MILCIEWKRVIGKDNIELNLAKRYPTLSNYDKTPDTSMMNVQVKNMPQYTYMVPQLKQFNGSKYLSTLTKNGISIPEENNRLNSCIVELLKSNPYLMNSMWGFPYGEQQWFKNNNIVQKGIEIIQLFLHSTFERKLLNIIMVSRSDTIMIFSTQCA